MKTRVRLMVILTVALVLGLLLEVSVFRTFGPMRGIFVQLSVGAFLSSLGTVLARNLVHAALYLIAFFFLVACLFILLEAEFLAAMQVLVYVGAVAILLMFGIMLTQDVQGEHTEGPGWRSLPAGLVAGGLLAMLVMATVTSENQGAVRMAQALPSEESREQAINDVSRSLGQELIQRYCVAFELVGLLLTASLVGAVVLARPREPAELPHSHSSGETLPSKFDGPLGVPEVSPANPSVSESHRTATAEETVSP